MTSVCNEPRVDVAAILSCAPMLSFLGVKLALPRASLVPAFFGPLLLGLSSVTEPACMQCSGAPCFSSLSLTFEEPGHTSLSTGAYVVELVLDEDEVSASCDVDGAAESVACGDLSPAQLGGTVVDDDDGRRTRLYITIEEPTPMPESVQVRITRDGETVLDDQFEPNYEPADPGCDDDCVHAVRHLVLAP